MWWIDQEVSFWDSLGWEILDFYDDETTAPWRIVHSSGKHISEKGLRSRDIIGAAMIAGGTAILIPGPIDGLAMAAGVAVFKHPLGAVAGIVAYNALGLALLAGGTALIAS